MTVEAWVELAALGLAGIAIWLSIPRPPMLDWERLWKVGLAAILAGEVERAGEGGGAVDEARRAWADRVRGTIPWHPAGRQAERKLAAPRPEEVPVPALEGERALVEELARLPDARARYRHLYAEDERGLRELLDHPAHLGPAHDPARLLGPDASWDEVVAWSPALQGLLGRRLGAVVVVTAGLRPGLHEALAAAAPGLRQCALPPTSGPLDAEETLAPLFAVIEEALRADSDRVVLVAQGRAVQPVLAALAAGAGLRDRCQAVVALGGQIQVPDFAGWLDAHFTHDRMDTELRRSIPYLSVIDVDPADPVASPWSWQRFPQPPPTPQGHAPVQAVDLGPLHLAGLDDAVLARGLLLLLALRLATQG